MKHLLLTTFTLLFSLVLFSCSDATVEVDKDKPVIDLSYEGAFPAHCSDTLYFGEPFTLKMRFTDNSELGSYSFYIHHNFDHHSHTTEFMECPLSPKKDPVNPLVFIDDYKIPEGLSEYVTEVEISIPASNEDGEFDEGDYCFQISLTDKEGWSTTLVMGINMRHR